MQRMKSATYSPYRNDLINVDPPGTGGAGGTGVVPPAAATPPAGPPPLDWAKVRDSLPEDIRKDPSMGPITSFEGLAKSFIHAQKAIGKDKISVPDKHASPEDWKGVFSKLGVPEKIEDYKLDLGEDTTIDPAVLDKVKAVAHQKGVLPWQFESIVKEFNQVAKGIADQQETEYKTSREGQINELKKSWGNEFDTQVKKANAALRHLLPDVKDQQALIDSGLGSNPAVLRMLSNAAKLMKNDDFVGQGDGKLAGVTPEDALQKARAIQGDMNHPYRNEAHPNHKAAKDEVANLYKIAFPE